MTLQKKINNKFKRALAGCTLHELLVVMVIIGLLAGYVGFYLNIRCSLAYCHLNRNLPAPPLGTHLITRYGSIAEALGLSP